MRLHKYKEFEMKEILDVPLGDGEIKKKALIISGKKIGGGSK